MMLPPLVRLGRPPVPDRTDTSKLVVLTNSGWHIVKWHFDYVMLIDQDICFGGDLYIHPADVLYWMPGDGS